MSGPLVVNTLDGTAWTRRGVLRGGEALYAMAGVCDCPEYVMATLAELAEHGIAGSADVLPAPMGSGPSGLERLRAQVAADAFGVAERAVAELKREHEESARLRAERDEFCNRVDTLTAVAKGNKRHVSEMFAELQKVQRERDEALARVAGLEAERHVTNEALDDAVQELRARREDAVPYTVTPEAHAQMREGLSRYFSGAVEAGDV